jgi:hypothetical protein
MGGSWKYALSSLKVDNSHLRSVSYKQETRRDIHVADGGADTDCLCPSFFCVNSSRLLSQIHTITVFTIIPV